jgi:hypothetical protein
MNVDRPDEQFELLLREFEPRRPRALPAPGVSPSIRMSRLAAAAVIAIALGSSLWFLSRKSEWRESQNVTNTASVNILILPKASTPKLSAVVLTRLAVEDPARLDALLDASQQHFLPRFDQENSALRVLAKE